MIGFGDGRWIEGRGLLVVVAMAMVVLRLGLVLLLVICCPFWSEFDPLCV